MFIDRLRDLHSIGYVHRDLKFDNLMFLKRTLFLIDFGNCIKIKPSKKGTVFGSLKFMSIRAHNYYTQTAKDDLETMLYMMINCFTDKMFWDIQFQNYREGQLD